jgi:endonuclease YncB( thermonuclease family)
MRADRESQPYGLSAEKELKKIVNVFTFTCKSKSALNDTPSGGFTS